MKSRIKESGSAVQIVIIVILIVAVLGALGYIFWQKNKQVDQTSNTPQTTETVKDTSRRFDEWAVKADMGQAGDAHYHFVTNTNPDGSTYQIMYFQPAGLPDDCTPSNIDYVARAKADEKISFGANEVMTASEWAKQSPDTSKQVGDYYYLYFKAPGGVCGDDAVMKLQGQANADALLFVQKVTAQ